MKGGLDDDVISSEKLCWNIYSLFPKYKNLKFVNSNAFSSPTITVLNEENWLIPITGRDFSSFVLACIPLVPYPV